MNGTIQRFAKKIRMLEWRQRQVARKLELAERDGNVSKSLLLEAQYREIVQTMGRLRRVLRALASARKGENMAVQRPGLG